MGKYINIVGKNRNQIPIRSKLQVSTELQDETKTRASNGVIEVE